jgi:hypothetical protein
MKKNYFLAAIAALVLGSCTSEEVLNQPSGVEDEASAIGFGTFLDRAPQNGVRPLASEMTTEGLHTKGFTVLAYSTGTAVWAAASATAPAEPNFMNNQKVEWDAGAWTYDPIKHWPKAGSGWGKVTFFGFSTVSGATATGVAGGNPQIYFETAASVTSQVDLVADVIENHTADKGKVKFAFEHILSKIGFKAKLEEAYPSSTVTVTSLEVYYAAGKVNSSGTYTFADNNDVGKWDLAGAATFPTASTVSGDPILSSESDALTSISGTTLTPPDKYLMLIPQKFGEGDIYVKLTYRDKTGEGPDGSWYTWSTIKLPETTLKSGKAYTYTFTIELGGGVKFETDDEEEDDDDDCGGGWDCEDEIYVPSPF